MVFRKQYNEEGKYIKKKVYDEEGNLISDGVSRFDIISCERTESLEQYKTGEYTEYEDENGETVQVPVIATRIVVNKGWDDYGTLENAIEQYGLEEYVEPEEVVPEGIEIPEEPIEEVVEDSEEKTEENNEEVEEEVEK